MCATDRTFLKRLAAIRAEARCELEELDAERVRLRAVIKFADRRLSPRQRRVKSGEDDRVLAAVAERPGIRASMVPAATGQREEAVYAAISRLSDHDRIRRDGLGWRVADNT